MTGRPNQATTPWAHRLRHDQVIGGYSISCTNQPRIQDRVAPACNLTVAAKCTLDELKGGDGLSDEVARLVAPPNMPIGDFFQPEVTPQIKRNCPVVLRYVSKGTKYPCRSLLYAIMSEWSPTRKFGQEADFHLPFQCFSPCDRTLGTRSREPSARPCIVYRCFT